MNNIIIHLKQNFYKNPVNLMILLIFIYPILRGFIIKYSSRDIKKSAKSLITNVTFLISVFLGIYWMKNIFFNHESLVYYKIYKFIPERILLYINNKPMLVYIIIIPVAIFIIHNILNLIFNALSKATIYPIFDSIDRRVRKKSSFSRRILGAIFQIPKSIIYVILVAFVLNFFSISGVSYKLNSYLEKSNYYNKICKQVVIPVSNSKLAKKLPSVINNSFKVVIKNDKEVTEQGQRPIIYYNGITLEEGVKSNQQINKFAIQMTTGCNTDREKALALYKWVGNNIQYDDEKADKVFRNKLDDIKSGAINTFYTRKGICFDYSCLYTAMCKANGIKTRIVIGDGFNGVTWVSHAWNEVYLKEEDRWINVDTTFAKGGNYFDSKRFNIDHKKEKVAGEF